MSSEGLEATEEDIDEAMENPDDSIPGQDADII
jgi:hypothetical protein